MLLLLASASPRYRELAKVVDRNTGFAHMTRGVNMGTLEALRSCVTERDIPVLAEMTLDRDGVVARAAAGVLADFGDAGRAALRGSRVKARDARTAARIDEAIASEARPLAVGRCQSMR